APLENVYLLCDHSRALAFMLNDGVVPSNVKEGYFSRLLVRKVLKALSFLGLDMKISELLEAQISQLKLHFPELDENYDGILRLAEVEEERYAETLKKGRSLVKRMEDKMKKEGQDRWKEKELIELYDSHGLTPDTVKEFTKLELETPQDFYMKVAEMHGAEGAEDETPAALFDVGGLPPTEVLYYDQKVLEFDAKVISIRDEFVILDKTYFYPEGGGELPDLGMLGKSKVIDVQKVENVALHKVEPPVKFKEGDEVHCMIDGDRRRRLTAHHTATHIVNGAARNLLGNHVWQAGAHKSTESARLDITHYKALTDEEISKLEELANNVVMRNLKVEKSFMDRAEAEKLYGFRLYQGGCVPGKKLRVVNIVGWDVEACGGTHCDYTGEVGHIKITGAKRIQDGVVRLEYVAGGAALAHVKKLEKRLKSAEKSLSEHMVEASKPWYAEKVLVDLMLERADMVDSVRVVSRILGVSAGELLKLAKEITGRGNAIAVIGSDKERAGLIGARSNEPALNKVNCAEELKKVLPTIDGSGGGKADYAQGGGTKTGGLQSAIDEAKKSILGTLEK
ncbi:MAG: alanine--tRNA ligase, partial [Thermoplasmata archaeon]|nr:alanine--tRNA ligase [Thermoplasmata archaeon]